jgi:hypothetical protein
MKGVKRLIETEYLGGRHNDFIFRIGIERPFP